MSHKTKEARAAYWQEWKAGIRRKKIDESGRVYIDNPIKKAMLDRDRMMRLNSHMKQKAKEQRKVEIEALCKQLKSDIERLMKQPFSWQGKSR